MRRSGLRHGMAVTVAVVALSLVTAPGASAQVVDEPSPTIATTEPEVPVERSEEMSATESRLRTIVIALAGLGGVVVVCTAIFWKVTRPPRRTEVEEALPGEVTPLLPPVTEAPPAPVLPAPVASSPDTSPADVTVAAPEVIAPPVAVDTEALDAARSLFDRLGTVPDMER